MIEHVASEVLFLHMNYHKLSVVYPAVEGENHRFGNLKSVIYHYFQLPKSGVLPVRGLGLVL